jgi:hypothetical protein
MPTKSLQTAVIVLFFGVLQARADCNPHDFAEIEELQRSPETELAFVLTASEQEYNSLITRGGHSTGTYGLITETKNYREAQDRARTIALATGFDYRTSYATSYFAQHLTSKAYLACLEKDRETPGLRVWLSHREGDFLTFGALWVGSDSKVHTATYDSVPVVDGGTIVSKPDQWMRGKVEEIVVKRSPDNKDIFFNLKVGGETQSTVVVRDPPRTIWNKSPVISQTLMRTTSHGSNPGCYAGEVTDCIFPTKPGSSFVSGSRAITERTSTDLGSYKEDFFVDTPSKVCVRMTQSTGACEVVNIASGRLMAIERYPVAAE